jgi:hypothetical protein
MVAEILMSSISSIIIHDKYLALKTVGRSVGKHGLIAAVNQILRFFYSCRFDFRHAYTGMVKTHQCLLCM